MNNLIKKLSLDLMQSNVITEESSVLDTTIVKDNSQCFISLPFDMFSTSMINSDEYISYPKAFTFKFVSGYTINFNLKKGIIYCPILKEKINLNTDVIEINLPIWIKEEDLSLYFQYMEKEVIVWNIFSALNLVRIAEYFENENAVSHLITQIIIPLINEDNCLNLLVESFQKVKISTFKEWTDMLKKCIEVISLKLPFFLINYSNKIRYLSNEIIDEIIEKYLYLVLNQKIVSSIPFKEILDIIMFSRNSNNLIEITIDDYKTKLTEESNKAIIKPNFNIKLKRGIHKSYFKEFSPIIFENQTITFILFYKESDKSINLSLRFSYPNTSSLKVLANLITVSLDETKSTHLKLVSCSNPCTYNVFTSSKFSESNILSSETLIINVSIQVNYVQSFLQNIVIQNYNSFYSDTRLKGLSKNNLFLLLQSPFTKFSSEDQLVQTLSIWLECENNLQENIESLIELINWRNISLDKVFEFVIRFSIILEKHNLSMFFTVIIDEKINQALNKNDYKIIGSLISEALFDSSNRVNFTKILNNLYLKDKIIANSNTNITHLCNKSSSNNNESGFNPFLFKHISEPAKENKTFKLEEPSSDLKAQPFQSSNISKISNNYVEEPFSDRSVYTIKTNYIEEENGKCSSTKRNKINSFDTLQKRTQNKPSFYNSKPTPLNIEGNTNKKNLEKLIKKVKENTFSPSKICKSHQHKSDNSCGSSKRYTVYLDSNHIIETSKSNLTEK